MFWDSQSSKVEDIPMTHQNGHVSLQPLANLATLQAGLIGCVALERSSTNLGGRRSVVFCDRSSLGREEKTVT